VIDAAIISAPIRAIVIGASAGGTEALTALLPRLPRGLRASVFVVVHLAKNRPSLLPQIFKTHCALPLRDAQDKEEVQMGTVYFAPPDYHLLLDAGPQIALSVDAPIRFSRPSVDVLFESAADVYGDRLLGIVLSGANDDGARGLKVIDEVGGKTIVQDPLAAKVATMPAAARRMVPNALVLSLPEIGNLLAALPADGAP
jgi:two-component system, chemotaxis family, protein-glutamate methylesterase/glutaminase